MFHVVSPIAMVMNLFLFFPLLIGLLSGLGVLVFGNLIPVLAWICGWICGASLAFSEWAIRVASTLPMSHWWLPSPPIWWVVVFYTLLSLCLIFRAFQSSWRRAIIGGLFVYFALGCIPWPAFLSQESVDRWIYFEHSTRDACHLSMNFVDVGHGTSVIAQMPNGENWLYDAGRMGDPDRAFYPIANTLWHLHIARIDRLFLSHADADHYNAIAALLKRFSVRSFYTTSQVLASREPSLQHLMEELKRQHIPINILSNGDQFAAGDAQCTILHPDNKPTYGSDNADSLTMFIECNNRRFLLPGDLEGAGINRLLQEPMAKLDVLMAPHHGSVVQNPKLILGWGKPDHVIISGGARANRKEVLEAFSQNMRNVWLTARDHALRVELNYSGEIIWKQWITDDWKVVELVPIAETNEQDDEGIETTAF
jgi:competence protein ComEC